MPERLDRVEIQLASREDPLSLPWDSRDKLLNELRDRESAQPIVAEFENAGAARPLSFNRIQKLLLFRAIAEWADRLGSISELPAVVWDLRCAIADDVEDEPERLARVHVNVAGEAVGITWSDRDELIEKLLGIAGCESIAQAFETVGASKPVELDDEQRSRLRHVLELWGISVMPDGLAPLLLALVPDVEASEPGRERIDVAGEIVEISRRDRDALLQELAVTAGHRALREKFEAAGEHRPVVLDRDDIADLHTMLETWEEDGFLPEGIAPLLAALKRADPSS